MAGKLGRLSAAGLVGLLCLLCVLGGCKKADHAGSGNPAALPPSALETPSAARPPAPAAEPAAAPAATPAPAPAPATSQRPASTPAAKSASGGSAGGAADWPAFRGPSGDGIAPGRINKDWKSKPPRTLWQVSLGDKGYAGPSVAGGKVFIVDHQGGNDVVKALDLKTGKEAWTFAYQDATSHNYGFARATPAYAGGKVYTLSRGGKLHCLDAASGSKLWLRELGAEFGGVRPKWDYSATPLVDGNRVVVCPGGATGLAVLDAATGKTLLTGGKGGPPGYATPVVATLGGQRQYVIFAGKELYGADTASGRTLWSTPWVTAHDVNAATPVVIDNFVFISSGYGVGCGLVKVSGRSASVVWKSAEIQAHFSSSLYLNRFLYGTGDPGNLVCLNPQDGKAMWKQPGFEKGGLVAVDGCLIVVSGNTGDVVLVKATPEGYEELGRVTPLGGQSWTAPVVAQGKLLVRNTQNLACLDLQ